MSRSHYAGTGASHWGCSDLWRWCCRWDNGANSEVGHSGPWNQSPTPRKEEVKGQPQVMYGLKEYLNPVFTLTEDYIWYLFMARSNLKFITEPEKKMCWVFNDIRWCKDFECMVVNYSYHLSWQWGGLWRVVWPQRKLLHWDSLIALIPKGDHEPTALSWIPSSSFRQLSAFNYVFSCFCLLCLSDEAATLIFCFKATKHNSEHEERRYINGLMYCNLYSLMLPLH